MAVPVAAGSVTPDKPTSEGVVVDAVLGLSVTPTAVGLVLVEGQDTGGETVDREAFEITAGRHASAHQICERAAAAVLRTEDDAVSRGTRLQSIGVTWTDDADPVASLLVRSLTECGFDNILTVEQTEATEALAWGIAEVIGYRVTAVCVIEAEAVRTLVVHTGEGAVQTAVNHTIDGDQKLLGWLGAVFAKADWRPEALVVVGACGDLDTLMPRLEDALAVPVFAPAESELALARGAALASAHHAGATPFHEVVAAPASGTQRRLTSHTGPVAMLTAGVVTFVVSVSIALGLELNPARNAEPVEPSPAARSSPETPAAGPAPAAIPAPVAEAPELAAPPAAPVEIAPPPLDVPAELPATVVDAAPEAPPAETPAQIAPAAPAPVPPPAGFDALPPESRAPGLVPAEPTPLPEQRPGILRRIKDRLSSIGHDDVPPPPPPPPPAEAAPPPPDVPLPPQP
ncbi:DUF7159 family protein [Mycolicibacterium sp. XJ1819]